MNVLMQDPSSLPTTRWRSPHLLTAKARWRLTHLAFIAVATSLVFWRIGSKPLWTDEIASVTYAHRSLPGIFHVLHVVDAPLGAYYLLLHFWLQVTSTPTGLRALSAMFAVAAAAVEVAMVRRWFGTLTGLVSGALLVLNPFFVRYAQEGRPYSLVLLLDTVGTWLFVNAVRTGRRRDLVGYVAVSVLAVYAHLFAILVLLVQAVSLRWWRDARQSWRRWLLSYTLIGAAVAPLLAFSAAHQTAAVAYLGGPKVESILAFGRQLAGTQSLLVVDAVILLAGFAAARLLPYRVARTERSWLLGLLAGMLVVPPLLLIALSAATPSFASRYLIATVMPLTVVLAVFLTRLRATPMWLGLALVSLLSARALWSYEQKPYKEQNIPAAIATVMDGSRPGDAIGYAPSVARRSFAYYWARYAGPGPRPVDIALAEPQPANAVFPVEVPPGALIAELAKWQRIWVVGNPHSFRHRQASEDMFRAGRTVLATEFHRTMLRKFGGITIVLYARNGTAG